MQAPRPSFPVWSLLLVVPLAGLSGCVTTENLSITGMFSIPAPDVSGPMPVPAVDCDALLDDLKERAILEARISLDRSLADRLGQGRGNVDIAVESMPATTRTGTAQPMAASDSSSAKGHTHSLHDSTSTAPTTGTNNQEAGVDEGDIVKSDGQWTYILSQGTLHIIRTRSIGDLDERATLTLGNPGNGELLLVPRGPGETDDRLVAILAGQPTTPADPPAGTSTTTGSTTTTTARPGAPRSSVPDPSRRDDAELQVHHGTSTRITIIGLADRHNPTIEHDLVIEGDATASRLVGDHVYAVISMPPQNLNLQRWISYETVDRQTAGLLEPLSTRIGVDEEPAVARHAAARIDAANTRRIEQADLTDLMPTIREMGRENAAGGEAGAGGLVPAAGDDCNGVLATPGMVGRGVTTVAAIAVGAAQPETRLRQVVGTTSIVYAAPDALVLAAPTQDLWLLSARSEVQADVQATTDLTWFALDGLAVDPVASGRVPGLLQDQFSLDVKGTELRVASTLGAVADLQVTWWSGRGTASISTQVTVLSAVAGQLVPTGVVTGIAPGERIWSARFTDERAYLVTFPDPVRIILRDPLWIIDLTTAVPTILGELEVPGVSTYIHPLSDDALLSIGYGPGPNDNGLDRNRIQVNLFDISDPSRPTRTSVLDLSPENGRAWSGAVAEHKAFSYWADAGLLAIPMTTTTESPDERSGAPRQHVALTLIDVDEETMKLSVRGSLEQAGLTPDGQAPWGTQIRRSYFHGFPQVGIGSVVSISDLGVTAHDIRDLRQQDAVAF